MDQKSVKSPMNLEERDSVQRNANKLKFDIENSKVNLVSVSQEFLNKFGRTTAEEQIKAEFEERRQNKLQSTIATLDNALDTIAYIRKMITKISFPPSYENAKKIMEAFGIGISALKFALKFLKDSDLKVINEKERITIEENASSWDHLIFDSLEDVEEELTRRHKVREQGIPGEVATTGYSFFFETSTIVGSICAAAIIFPKFGRVAIAITGGLAVINTLSKKAQAYFYYR